MVHTFTVEEYLKYIGRCVEPFEPPIDPAEQFRTLSNIQKNEKILKSLQVKYFGMLDFLKFKPNDSNYY